MRRGWLVAAVAGLALAGCTLPLSPSPQTEASAARRAACRQHADDVYMRRNPADIYQSDLYAGGQRDAPLGGAGMAGDPTRGLAGRYQRANLYDACLSGSGTPSGPSPDRPVPGPPKS
ncbi:MAG: hypothetical protein KGJ41_17960 [Rhodospirillales bacterium]|nr:hypothetical protein [Rhodospirillales bacterium]MDE2574888.1 hypothetical protein [Rhodospirillales bacterium]